MNDWTAVVKLGGWKPATSSLGLKFAWVQNRVFAVANWKSVKIWPLDATELLQKGGETYNTIIPDDADPNMTQTVPLVEAIELDTHGDVVFELAFTDSKTLWGLTDRGVVRWDLGLTCCGRIMEEDLPLFDPKA
jgi:hypothetical protein